MARDEAYRKAEQKIEAARKSGAKELDLSVEEPWKKNAQKLTELPDPLWQLTQLQSLNLRDNQLTALPKSLGQLTQLRELNLRGNRLTALPESLSQLIHLRELDLDSNQLTALPESLGQLTQLRELDLDSNQLTALPESLGQLTQLRKLRLNNNQLTALPKSLGQLTQLQSLSLYNNQLTALPESLGQLTQMRLLNLYNNQLTALPESLGQLTQLQLLNLYNNQLTVLPESLGQLTQLQSLNLYNNRLTALPESLGQLTQLQALDLTGNPLANLTKTLLCLPLEEIDFDGLLELGIAKDIIRRSRARLSKERYILLQDFEAAAAARDDEKQAKARIPDGRSNCRAILDFYFALKEQGVAPMREVRLLSVGRGRVGKTSLLRVLRRENPREAEPETPGITVLPLMLECGQGQATAHAWDFGGQEFLHGTHQIFLSERCVYLLVLEGRDDLWRNEADYWLRFIQSFGGDSPVIVALNKYDAHKFSVDEFRMRESCSQIAGFINTDAFTGRGIEELLRLIEKTVSEMPDVWLGVAKRWHAVKEHLARMPESYVEYTDYQKLCVAKGVTDDGQQDSLAQNLHRLGIALNFRDHHRLKHTSVLKPRWVVNGIYGLLRFAKEKECHGVLREEWIAEALDKNEYPLEKYPFVMELMEKFEVAFTLEEVPKQQGKRWLIPELLPENQPQAFAEFRKHGVTRLRYSYPEALPPGLLPRLIVRTHEMSEAHPEARWRSGVLLEWGECKALVRLDRNERKTLVEVLDCPAEDRRNLFDIIRAHLRVLHGNVRVVEDIQVKTEPEKWMDMDELRIAEREDEKDVKVAVTPNQPRMKVPVQATLDLTQNKPSRDAEGPNAPRRMRLFVSYAHKDERKLKPLNEHLTLLGQNGYIQHWQDKDLVAGEKWAGRIAEEIGKADIVLVVYSVASRGSKFIPEHEVRPALTRAREGMCRVIVLPLYDADFDKNSEVERELSALQTATWNAKPVLDFTPQRKGWEAARKAIENAVDQLRNSGESRVGT